MGCAGAVLPITITCGASVQMATTMATTTDCRGDPVSAAQRAAMADVTALLSSGLDGARLVLPVARQWALALAQSRFAADRPGSGRTRGLTQRSGDR